MKNCKIKIFFLGLLIAKNAWALKGEVTHLKVPLLKSMDSKAEILEWVRKGEVVFIHGDHDWRVKEDLIHDQEKMDLYEESSAEDYLDRAFQNKQEEEKKKFYRTLDSLGRDAYIDKSYVKILYQDLREEEEGETKETRPDLTDYRLTEPIAPNYPLELESKNRHILLGHLGVGTYNPQTLPPHWINSSVQKAPYFDFELTYLFQPLNIVNKKVFGGISLLTNYLSHSLYDLNHNEMVETRFRLGVGPTTRFEFFVKQEWRMALESTFFIIPLDTINLQQSGNDQSSETNYRSFSFLLRNSLLWIIPTTFNANVVVGAGIDITLPHTYQSYTASYMTRSWEYNGVFFAGVQTSY